MSASLTVLTRSKAPWVVQAAFASVLAVATVVLWFRYPSIGLPKDVEAYVPLFCGAFLGLCLVAVAMSVVFISDQKPKLAVDANGVEDFRRRGGSRYIAWADVQSLDAEITTLNGAVQTARVTFYVVGPGGTVETVRVEVGGLSQRPEAVVGLLKKQWVQFNYDRGRAAGAGP